MDDETDCIDERVLIGEVNVIGVSHRYAPEGRLTPVAVPGDLLLYVGAET